MELKILEADIHGPHAAGAIFLPIDGRLPASASDQQIARSLGAIARGFDKKFPAAELLEEIESQVSFPVPLGRAVEVELGGDSPYRWAILLSMLPHQQDDLGSDQVRAATAGALASAVEVCHVRSIRRARTPLLTGGWRLPAPEAMALMLGVLADPLRARAELELEVCIHGPDAAATVERMRALARTVGFGG